MIILQKSLNLVFLSNITLNFTVKNPRYFGKFDISKIFDRRGKIFKICNNIDHINLQIKYNDSKSSGTSQTKNRFGGGVKFLPIFEGYNKVQAMCLTCAYQNKMKFFYIFYKNKWFCVSEIFYRKISYIHTEI